MRVSGSQLVVTADTAAPGCSVIVHVVDPSLPGGSMTCDPVRGRNVTAEALSGCDLTPVQDHNVVLELQLQGNASLYMIGFRNARQSH